MNLYLLKPKHLLYHYTNLLGDFSDKIRFHHISYDHIWSKHQPDIIEIIIYYKIVKKELFDKNRVYNNKKSTM